MKRHAPDEREILAWYLHAGLMLGYPEADVWRMTPRKLSILYRAHIQYLKEQYAVMWAAFPSGGSSGQARGSIDDAIPF